VPKKSEVISDVLAQTLKDAGANFILVEGQSEAELLSSLFQLEKSPDGKEQVIVVAAKGLSPQQRRLVYEKELGNVFALTDSDLVTTTNFDRLLQDLVEPNRKSVDLSVSSVIIPERKIAEGVLIKATSLIWASIIEQLEKDWTKAFEIPPRVWEEIIAGAFVKAGFDEVTLTPRSNDHGRDVIAVRKGVGSIRILDSVKAYSPGHLVTKEEVHALMGVVALDPNASKGIFTTTSLDFAHFMS